MRFNFLTTVVAAFASLGAATISTERSPLKHSNEQSLNPRLTTVPLAPRDLPIGTCNSGTPCANGACCSKTKLCGYSKDFCGDGCQHNCKSRFPWALEPQLTKHFRRCESSMWTVCRCRSAKVPSQRLLFRIRLLWIYQGILPVEKQG